MTTHTPEARPSLAETRACFLRALSSASLGLPTAAQDRESALASLNALATPPAQAEQAEQATGEPHPLQQNLRELFLRCEGWVPFEHAAWFSMQRDAIMRALAAPRAQAASADRMSPSLTVSVDVKRVDCTPEEMAAELTPVIEKSLRNIMRPASEEPPPGLLMSMAIRFDHALGCPGYYDSPLFRGPNQPTHAQRLESTLRQMRQLWEEVTGRGFYRPEREAEYVTMSRGAEPGDQA